MAKKLTGLDLSQAFKLAPAKAVKFFESKGYKIDWDWADTWEEANATAFTVAKAMKADVLSTIHAELNTTLKSGMTEAQFIKTLEPRLQALGWWGVKKIKGPDGVKELVQLGSPHRLKTIFRVNMNTARAAAHYKNAKANAEDRPYWQYDAADDGRTRPSHAALGGMVFRHDDPFWDSHYPPNGFNCRCLVRALDEAEMKEEGLTVTDSRDHLSEVQQEVGIDKKTGEVRKERAVKFSLGNTVMVPDAGWNYNPGRAGLSQLQAIENNKLQSALNAPGKLNTMVKQSIHEGLNSTEFPKFIAQTREADREQWAIAAVTADRAKAIGLKSGEGRIARLNSAAAVNNRSALSEFESGDWEAQQRIIDSGTWQTDGAIHAGTLVESGKTRRLTLRRTDADDLYLETYGED